MSLTPPQIAKRYRVSPEKVLGWIRRGELRAINIAMNPHGKRPRWIITAEALADFEQARSSRPAPRPSPRTRRSASENVIQFFT
jgi:transposase